VNVLIADHDPQVRALLRSLVDDLGHLCRSADNAHDAWAEAEKLQPDVLVADWSTKELDGVELVRMLRRHDVEKSTFTYVVIAVAYRSRPQHEEAIRAGADVCLERPIDLACARLALEPALRFMSRYRHSELQVAGLEAVVDGLVDLARQDPVTRIGNYRRLREDLEILQGRVDVCGHSYAVVQCSIDDFAEYQMVHGAARGHQLLRQIGSALGSQLRHGDQLYRYSEDGFIAILPEPGGDTTGTTEQHLRRVVADLAIPRTDTVQPQSVTITTGSALCAPRRQATAETVLAVADTAVARSRSEQCEPATHARNVQPKRTHLQLVHYG